MKSSHAKQRNPRHKARARRNLGRVYQRGGAWYADYTHQGERFRVVGGNTRAEAQARLVELRKEVRPHKDEHVYLSRWLNACEADMKRRRLKAKTIESNRTTFNTALEIWPSNMSVRKAATREALEAFVDARSELSAVTVAKDLRVLHGAFRVAVERGWLEKIPALPKVKHDKDLEPHIISPRQRDHLLSCARYPQIRAIMTAAAFSGARSGELRQLRWRDVQGWGAGSPEMVFRRTKKRRDRRVPIHPRVVKVIRDNLDGRTPSPGDLVFPNTCGREWPTSELSHAAGTVWRAAELFEPGHTKPMHSLRASAATWMLEANATLADIMAVCGWASIATLPSYLASRSERRHETILALR